MKEDLQCSQPLIHSTPVCTEAKNGARNFVKHKHASFTLAVKRKGTSRSNVNLAKELDSITLHKNVEHLMAENEEESINIHDGNKTEDINKSY